MKINQPMISPQPKKAVKDIPEKTGVLAEGQIENEKVAEDDGVTLDVSRRNNISVNETEENAPGGMKSLLNSLLSNPDATSKIHSQLSPERVLQLLS